MSKPEHEPKDTDRIHLRLGRDFMSGTRTGDHIVTELKSENIRFMRNAYKQLREQIALRIVGLEDVVEELLICLFAGGHTLLVGVPGLAKTLLIRSLAESLSLDYSRIQFTPDMMPSDITGTEVITRDSATGERSFRFMQGPVFANLILADEINRTPPKTQAALLEAMEEGSISSVGQCYHLDPPFFVMATQNPIEQEGTYPLPFAQLDRFMFNCVIDYPPLEDEYKIVRRTVSSDPSDLSVVLSSEDLLKAIQWVRFVRIDDHLINYCVSLARHSRPANSFSPPFVKEWVQWGAGPRAPQYLILAAKARALLSGRNKVKEEDVRRVALPVLRHRMVLSFHAEADGVDADAIVSRLLAVVPRTGRPLQTV